MKYNFLGDSEAECGFGLFRALRGQMFSVAVSTSVPSAGYTYWRLVVPKGRVVVMPGFRCRSQGIVNVFRFPSAADISGGTLQNTLNCLTKSPKTVSDSQLFTGTAVTTPGYGQLLATLYGSATCVAAEDCGGRPDFSQVTLMGSPTADATYVYGFYGPSGATAVDFTVTFVEDIDQRP